MPALNNTTADRQALLAPQALSRFRLITGLVRNRRGQFSIIRLLSLLGLITPAAWFALLYSSGQLGARPILALVHASGLWTIRLLLVALCLSPARSLLRYGSLIEVRRMTGVACACYAVMHVSLYITQQNWHLLHVGSEILHRLYLAIGLVVFAILVALGLTSTDGAVRRLGRNWKRLHRCVYLAALLGSLHYMMQTKADVSNAVISAGLLCWLYVWRGLPVSFRNGLPAAFLLMFIAPSAAALIEYVWYTLATRVHAERVLAANLHFAHLRPSAWVAIWSAGIFVAVAVARSVVRGQRPTRVVPAAAQSVSIM